MLSIPPRSVRAGEGSRRGTVAAATAGASPNAVAAACGRAVAAQQGHLRGRRLQKALSIWGSRQQAGQREAACVGGSGARGAPLLQPRPQQQAALRAGQSGVSSSSVRPRAGMRRPVQMQMLVLPNQGAPGSAERVACAAAAQQHLACVRLPRAPNLRIFLKPGGATAGRMRQANGGAEAPAFGGLGAEGGSGAQAGLGRHRRE